MGILQIFCFRLFACLPLCTGLGVAALQRGNRVDIASEPTWPHSALEPSRENKDQKFSGFYCELGRSVLRPSSAWVPWVSTAYHGSYCQEVTHPCPGIELFALLNYSQRGEETDPGELFEELLRRVTFQRSQIYKEWFQETKKNLLPTSKVPSHHPQGLHVR